MSERNEREGKRIVQTEKMGRKESMSERNIEDQAVPKAWFY